MSLEIPLYQLAAVFSRRMIRIQPVSNVGHNRLQIGDTTIPRWERVVIPRKEKMRVRDGLID